MVAELVQSLLRQVVDEVADVGDAGDAGSGWGGGLGEAEWGGEKHDRDCGKLGRTE